MNDQKLKKTATILKSNGGTQEASIATASKAIRAKCLDCSGGSTLEVKECPIAECPLYPWRFGKNPFRKPLSEAERMARVDRMRRIRREAVGA